MTDAPTLEQRIDRIESRIAIGELPTRYARAVDARDIDTWIGLFVEDVNCGRYGTGREALRQFIEPSVRTFYRSIHFIAGHTVDFIDDDTADGTTYCRAEHEDGDQWVTMAIVYFDRYVRRDGKWYFERRREKHWYSVDELERPRAPFQLWDKWADRLPHLPQDFPTWAGFWDKSSAEDLARITRQPAVSTKGGKA
jgi:hypothetical protein